MSGSVWATSREEAFPLLSAPGFGRVWRAGHLGPGSGSFRQGASGRGALRGEGRLGARPDPGRRRRRAAPTTDRPPGRRGGGGGASADPGDRPLVGRYVLDVHSGPARHLASGGPGDSEWPHASLADRNFKGPSIQPSPMSGTGKREGTGAPESGLASVGGRSAKEGRAKTSPA